MDLAAICPQPMQDICKKNPQSICREFTLEGNTCSAKNIEQLELTLGVLRGLQEHIDQVVQETPKAKSPGNPQG